MKRAILIINCGSSSIKLSLYECTESSLIFSVHAKRLNSPSSMMNFEAGKKKAEKKLPPIFTVSDTIKAAYQFGAETFQGSFSITAIGHRFVHGGSDFTESCLITDSVISRLSNLNHMAPLHNKSCLDGIEACKSLFPGVVQIAIFDTAFHKTMPPVAYTYAIPSNIANKHQIRRYGFHGISTAFIWNTFISKKLGTDKNRTLIAHLGNGCSITAISNGKSIDTSMGFSPLEGLVMATRSGDIDPAVVDFLSANEALSTSKVLDVLNYNSGLLGVSNKSSRMEILLSNCEIDPASKLAVDLFCYRIVKYIGAYMAVLQGLDTLIFTGGIGEGSAVIRERISTAFEWYGAKLDCKTNNESLNILSGEAVKISNASSNIDIFVIGTDENRYMTEEVMRIMYGNSTPH